MPVWIFLLLCFTGIGCAGTAETEEIAVVAKDTIVCKTTLCIQPLGDFDSVLTGKLKAEIQKCYDVEITVNGLYELPDSAYYAPGDIYSASTLLRFLDKVNAGRYDKIIGLTDRHIYHPKDNYPYWGIFGLSNVGHAGAAVVSSYRIQLYSPADKYYPRLVNTVIHELGHAFGLYHCPDKTCVMTSWYGSWDNIDKMDNAFCKDCKVKLEKVLKK